MSVHQTRFSKWILHLPRCHSTVWTEHIRLWLTVHWLITRQSDLSLVTSTSVPAFVSKWKHTKINIDWAELIPHTMIFGPGEECCTQRNPMQRFRGLSIQDTQMTQLHPQIYPLTLAFILIQGMLHLVNSSYGMLFLNIIRIQPEKWKLRSRQFCHHLFAFNEQYYEQLFLIHEF